MTVNVLLVCFCCELTNAKSKVKLRLGQTLRQTALHLEGTSFSKYVHWNSLAIYYGLAMISYCAVVHYDLLFML